MLHQFPKISLETFDDHQQSHTNLCVYPINQGADNNGSAADMYYMCLRHTEQQHYPTFVQPSTYENNGKIVQQHLNNRQITKYINKKWFQFLYIVKAAQSINQSIFKVA